MLFAFTLYGEIIYLTKMARCLEIQPDHDTKQATTKATVGVTVKKVT